LSSCGYLVAKLTEALDRLKIKRETRIITEQKFSLWFTCQKVKIKSECFLKLLESSVSLR